MSTARSAPGSSPWLDPDFRKWDITEALGYIRVPILIVQGEDDQYGTLRQVEVAQGGVLLPGRDGRARRGAPLRRIATRPRQRWKRLPASSTGCCATTARASRGMDSGVAA